MQQRGQNLSRQLIEKDFQSIVPFVAKEVEKTDALGLDTLFLPQLIPAKNILLFCRKNNIEHVYLPANKAYNRSNQKEYIEAVDFLSKSLHVTLDIPAQDLNLYQTLVKKKNVTILLHVCVDYALECSNVYLRLDSTTTFQTNESVWVIPISDITTAQYRTKKEAYENDKEVRLTSV